MNKAIINKKRKKIASKTLPNIYRDRMGGRGMIPKES
jgi:hypothetical protein